MNLRTSILRLCKLFLSYENSAWNCFSWGSISGSLLGLFPVWGNEYRILIRGIKNCVRLATGLVVQSKVCILGWRERNQQDATNLMFIIKLLSQHVSGIIMPIIGRTRVCTAAYGALHWLWWLWLCTAGTQAVCTVKVTVRTVTFTVHRTATYSCDDTKDCIIQFWPPDDKHMCSKHVEAWNKLIIKFSASSWLILINKYIEMHGQQNIKKKKKVFCLYDR